MLPAFAMVITTSDVFKYGASILVFILIIAVIIKGFKADDKSHGKYNNSSSGTKKVESKPVEQPVVKTQEVQEQKK